MVEGIAFYALYTSSALIIPCKADDFSLFIGLPDENYKKGAVYRFPILKLIFSLFCGLTLRKHCIIKSTWAVL